MRAQQRRAAAGRRASGVRRESSFWTLSGRLSSTGLDLVVRVNARFQPACSQRSHRTNEIQQVQPRARGCSEPAEGGSATQHRRSRAPPSRAGSWEIKLDAAPRLRMRRLVAEIPT